MNTSKEKLLRFAERVLKRTKAYQYNRELSVPDEENYKMSYLLVKSNGKTPESILAYAVNDESALLFHPMKEPVYEIILNDWQFSFDYDLFQYLEEGYDLTAMTPDAHSGVWYEIAEYHDTSGIACVDGMQKYLDYCKRNGVTKDRLVREADYDGMDVMTLYDREAAKTVPEKKPKDLER